MILNHVSLGTQDLSAALTFYDAVLATLGVTRSHLIDGEAAAYGEAFEFWIGCPCDSGTASAGAGSHIAFTAPSRQAVEQFYQVALAQGGRCAGAPGLRPYGKHYYAAYIYDRDGNKLEAVTTVAV